MSGKARAVQSLKRLETCAATFGKETAPRKLALLRALERSALKRARDVTRLHEVLCFLAAYPDNQAVLDQVRLMLAEFGRRRDLRRFRDALENTGIHGTATRFSFFAPMARWLAERWGPHLSIHWDGVGDPGKVEALLDLFALYSEGPGLDELDYDLREWLDLLKGSDETAAAFLVRRFAAVDLDTFAWERLYNDFDLELTLAPGPGTPSRSMARFDGSPVHFQEQPINRSRPSVEQLLARPPRVCRNLSPRAARQLIDLAREAMATRNRELDVFSYADRHDVCLLDFPSSVSARESRLRGVQLVFIGAVPERRLMLESLYGYLVLKNGVPVGYGVVSSLFGSSEIAFNVFDSFRAGEAALFYAGVLAAAKHLFGSDTFMVDTYQIGEENEEAIASGAWWFYQKLGFRSRDREVLRLMNKELRRMAANPRHRSSPATLRKLATAPVFLAMGQQRDDVMGVLSMANVGLAVTRNLSARFGSGRRRGADLCAREAAQILGVRTRRGFTRGERLAWHRWAPLVLVLPGVARWPREDKKALVDVIKSKGGRRERDFVLRFNRHRRLRNAIRKLAS